MKQVNVWLDDDVHMLLVKAAAAKQLETGKITKVSTLAATILKQSLNGKQDNEPIDNKQETTETPTEDSIPPKSNPFADLNF